MALTIVEFPDGTKFSNRSAEAVTDPDETGLADGGHDPGLLVMIEKTIEQAAEAVAGGAVATDAADTATTAAGTATTQAGIATAAAGTATTKAAEAAASALAAAAAVGGVKVSSDDAAPGHLETKLAFGDGLVAATASPGGAEVRQVSVDPDLELGSPTISTRLTIAGGVQSLGLELGDVSGEVVLTDEMPEQLYCTIVGDTTFLVAGGSTPGGSHQHLMHWEVGGAGGYSVAKLPLAQNTFTRDYRSTAEAGESRPWTDSNTSLDDNAGVGPDGLTTLTKLIADAVSGSHTRSQAYSAALGANTLVAVAKAAEYERVQISWDGTVDGVSTSITLQVNLATGVITTAASSGVKIVYTGSAAIALPNSCYLIWITASWVAAASGSFRIHNRDNTGAGTFTGNASDGVLLGDSNIYPGAFAGIQTVGATRAGQVVEQGVPVDFTAISAGETGDLWIGIEPRGRIVVQDDTVETL